MEINNIESVNQNIDNTSNQHSKKGLNGILPNLSLEDKQAVKAELNSMNQTDRISAIQEMNNISIEGKQNSTYVSELFEILSPE